MARSVANVNQTTDNFAQWLDKTNTLLTAFSTEIVTANVATGWTTGNAQVNGFFSANTLIAGSALRGGNVTSNATLTITANLVANFTANVTGATALANTLLVIGTTTAANIIASAVIIGSSPVTIATNSASTSSTTQTVVDSFPKSEGRFVKYLVGVRNNANTLVHSIELMAIHDDTTVSLSKYGEVFNTAVLGTFDSIINNANAELKFTAANSTVYTIKTTRMHM